MLTSMFVEVQLNKSNVHGQCSMFKGRGALAVDPSLFLNPYFGVSSPFSIFGDLRTQKRHFSSCFFKIKLSVNVCLL